MKSIGILGAGSFGTALSNLCAEQGIDTHLWCRRAELQRVIERERCNPPYLGDLHLSAAIQTSCDINRVCHRRDALLFAVPSQYLRDLLIKLPKLPPKLPLIVAAKGIEAQTLMSMDEVVCDVLGSERRPFLLALSGPSFAKELVERHHTSVVIASENETLARKIGDAFFCDYFRAYASSDLVGVEMGGALKNIMAIAAGGLVGMGFGKNTHAGLVTRGLAEISRLAVAKGAHPMTLAGLSGMGDLVLTCGSAQSRNQRTGVMIGQGKSVAEAVARIGQVVEGVATTKSAYQLAKKLQVDVPIIEAVYSVLHEGKPAKEALLDVIRRVPTTEY